MIKFSFLKSLFVALSLLFAVQISFALPLSIEWSDEDKANIEKRGDKVKAKGGEYIFESKYYHVTTNISPEFTSSLSYYMDQFYLKMEKDFPFKNKVKTKPKVLVFKNFREYQDAIGEASNSRGWFKYGHRKKGFRSEFPIFHLYSYVKYPWESQFEHFYIPILNHEGIHQILKMKTGVKKFPLFINEGLASYYQFYRLGETDYFDKRKNRSEYRPVLKHSREKLQEVSLESLFSIVAPWDIDGYGAQTKMRYALAESFCAFLLETKEGQAIYPKILKKSIEGKSITKILGKVKLKQIDKRWKEFTLETYLID